jgi:ABC-type uncharacterized transport system ATPase subunit
LIEFFGLADRLTTLRTSLFKGLKKETTISAAVLHEPGVRIDDPFPDLEPLIRRKLKD